MRILHVASELYPFVKTGGLGDVMAALPPALVRLGADARVLLPGYPALMSALEDLAVVERRRGGMVRGDATLQRGRLPRSGLRVYLIDSPDLFDRPGNPYLGPDGNDWPDNHLRFALLGRIAADLASGDADAAWTPDIVHAHDWHAGLAPVYMRAQEIVAGSVFTIHNLGFQGLFPPDVFPDLGLPESHLSVDGLEYYGRISFMKGGIGYADRVTTVSPTYAAEIRTPAFGFGLDGLLRRRDQALSGILNGADYDIWSPEADPALPAPYSSVDLSGKQAVKASLQRTLGLAEDPDCILFGAVTRLTEQKGFDLVLEALPDIVRNHGQLALLGSGDAGLEAKFREVAATVPRHVAVRIGFDETLAHAIVGGADVVLVPSRFEPCGLTQLYAMRYGTLPLVHRIGGLADTVADASSENLAAGVATGIVVDAPTIEGLRGAIGRAADLFADKGIWSGLQQRAMAENFGWGNAAERYMALYRSLSADR